MEWKISFRLKAPKWTWLLRWTGSLDELAHTKPEWCDLVEVKYFLGLTDEEAAEVLGMKLRSMQRMWRDARRWLFEQTESGYGKASAGR
jgi:DNA-directed RNA polymerase specialized sigma24 family protein